MSVSIAGTHVDGVIWPGDSLVIRAIFLGPRVPAPFDH